MFSIFAVLVLLPAEVDALPPPTTPPTFDQPEKVVPVTPPVVPQALQPGLTTPVIYYGAPPVYYPQQYQPVRMYYPQQFYYPSYQGGGCYGGNCPR